MNECDETPGLCGSHAQCFNTMGSYYCQCESGYGDINGNINFTAFDGQCKGERTLWGRFMVCFSVSPRSRVICVPPLDKNECDSDVKVCGRMTDCINLIGSFRCICQFGYTNTSSTKDCIGNCHVVIRVELLCHSK